MEPTRHPNLNIYVPDCSGPGVTGQLADADCPHRLPDHPGRYHLRCAHDHNRLFCGLGREKDPFLGGAAGTNQQRGTGICGCGIAFNNDPEILGAATGIILVQIIVGTVVASYFAKGQPAPEETVVDAQPA